MTAQAPRYLEIDRLRGLAIVTMVAANMAGELLGEPHPFWFRVYGSFAAPVFISLAGLMVSITCQKPGRGLAYYGLRGGLILVLAAFIDSVIWHLYPFISFDVLYSIGFAMPLAYLLTRGSHLLQWGIPILIFLLTPLLQDILGYQAGIQDYELASTPVSTVLSQALASLHRFLIDGWFPLFPWLGFALLGIPLGSKIQAPAKTFLGVGVGFLLIGVLLFQSEPGPLYTRDGYSELFYPPTVGYLLMGIGALSVGLGLFKGLPAFSLFKPLEWLGQCALFIYLLHATLISYLLRLLWPMLALSDFLQLYTGVLFCLVGIAYGIKQLKQRWTNMPFILRFWVGT